MKSSSTARKLLESGIILSAINFLTGLGNYGFQAIMGHRLNTPGQYSQTNSAINAVQPMMGLVSTCAIYAVTHYVAHFNAVGDTTRLQGLMAGCRRFLFRLTIFGSILAIIGAEPLSAFFGYSWSLIVVTLISSLLGLWTSLATALCQGLAWFKRLALIGFLFMLMKVTLSYFIALRWATPEAFVVSSTVALSAYFILLIWRKDLSLPKQTVTVSPWNYEFILYLVISAAFVVGNYCFMSSDLLVMQRYFSKTENGDAYTAAERLAQSLPITVAPLLTVLFTNRSVAHGADAIRAQMKLIALYAGGLIFGAFALFVLRHYLLKVIGKDTPEAAAMIVPLAAAMTFMGLIQAVGTWALASRWTKMALLYGALGVSYTTMIFIFGKTPDGLLSCMPPAAAACFVILFLMWVIGVRRHKQAV